MRTTFLRSRPQSNIWSGRDERAETRTASSRASSSTRSSKSLRLTGTRISTLECLHYAGFSRLPAAQVRDHSGDEIPRRRSTPDPQVFLVRKVARTASEQDIQSLYRATELASISAAAAALIMWPK